MSKKEIVFEIVEHMGVISRKNNSTKELNLVSWAGREPSYDIRNWGTDEDGDKRAFKGISLSREELIDLKELLLNIDLEV